VKRRLSALTFEDIAELKSLCEIHAQNAVARLYNVHESTVSRARRGISWRVDARPVRPNFTNAKLKTSDVEDIRRLEGHLRIVDLAQMFKIHRSTVHRIVTGRTWRDPE
jgi:hypothetical protein